MILLRDCVWDLKVSKQQFWTHWNEVFLTFWCLSLFLLFVLIFHVVLCHMALVNDLSLSPQEDCEAENVWEMGGLGILTSVPITPRVVCFLCASSGHVEVRSPASWYVRQYERLFCCDETNHYILFRWFIAGTIPCLNQQFKCFCFLEISERSLLFFFFPENTLFIYLFFYPLYFF